MSTIVQRAPADKPGTAIVSSILTTIEARLERGTYEINNEMDDRIIMEGTVIDLDFYQPGRMALVDNKGIIKNGLITKHGGRFVVNGRSVDAKTTTTVETIK